MTTTRRNLDIQRAFLTRNVEALRLLQDSACVVTVISELQSAIAGCLETDGKVILCGNGGFAAVSQHMAAELMGKYLSKGNLFRLCQ